MSTTRTKCTFTDIQHKDLTKVSIEWALSKDVKIEGVTQYLGGVLKNYGKSKGQSIESLYYTWRKIPFVKAKGDSFKRVTVQKLLERTIGFNPCSLDSVKDNQRLSVFNDEMSIRLGVPYNKPYVKKRSNSTIAGGWSQPVNALFELCKQDDKKVAAFLEQNQQAYIEYCKKH